MTTLGEVIATGRLAAGMTQSDLALAAGVTQAALSRYEKDLREPDDQVVNRLADALGVTARFMRHASRPAAALAVDAHMRRRATARPTVWRRLEARLNMLRMHADLLREQVSLEARFTVPGFDPLTTDPAEAARLTRSQWQVPMGPLQSVTRWIEAAGGIIVLHDLGNGRVDGLSQWTADHPVVIVNAAMPPDRIRWTLAHELGHLVLHREDALPEAEAQANFFAGEFLMPEIEIRSDLPNLTLGKAVDLKREWGVSVQAVIERAFQLGTVTPERRTSLHKQVSARGWRIREPASEDIPREQPELLSRIEDHLLHQGLGRAEIAAMLGYRAPEDNSLMPAREHLLHLV